jgi:hypothetical protein
MNEGCREVSGRGPEVVGNVAGMQEPLRLTPAQERTLGLLRRGETAIVFDAEMVDDLRNEATERFDDLAQRLNGRELFITKHVVSGVLGCEVQHLQPDDFAWTPARARGQVSHKAIQLMLHWRGEPTPSELVDEAMGRLVDEERDFGKWLGALGAGDTADLRGQSVERVTKFAEAFPPLDPRSHPMTEAAAQWPVAGPILLRARTDLVMGKPIGRESRKLIIDLKTGRHVDRHRHDLRFYALVETLVREVPPRKLATFYLDAAQPVTEDVSEPLLRAALRRTIAAAERLVELQVDGLAPVKRTGPACNWCPLRTSCPEGLAFLGGDAERGDED